MNDVTEVKVHLWGHGVACHSGFRVNFEGSSLCGPCFCCNVWKIRTKLLFWSLQLYHVSARLAFGMWCVKMWWRACLLGQKISPQCFVSDAAQRTGTRGTNVPALCLDQPSVRVAPLTFKTPPTSTQTVQVLLNLPLRPPLTSENSWPFAEPFQRSALPLGGGSVCIDEVIFPG